MTVPTRIKYRATHSWESNGTRRDALVDQDRRGNLMLRQARVAYAVFRSFASLVRSAIESEK